MHSTGTLWAIMASFHVALPPSSAFVIATTAAVGSRACSHCQGPGDLGLGSGVELADDGDALLRRSSQHVEKLVGGRLAQDYGTTALRVSRGCPTSWLRRYLSRRFEAFVGLYEPAKHGDSLCYGLVRLILGFCMCEALPQVPDDMLG